MSEVYIGQIRAFGFSFPPNGWAQCNGQLLPIQQNQALFSLLGTNYGGNGQTNFALPNLQGRVSVHAGMLSDGDRRTFGFAEAGGEEFHTLTAAEMPGHTHTITAGATATSADPTGNLLASPGKKAFGVQSTTTLHPQSTVSSGASQPHENRPPYTVLNYCIALAGIFPSRN